MSEPQSNHFHLEGWSTITPSRASMRLTNPIRDIVDLMKKPEIPDKPLISLSIGIF